MKAGSAIRRPVQTVTLDMSQGGGVTTTTYLTLLAKASNVCACSAIEIFNPSGSPMILAIGDAGSEKNMNYTILPGGTTGILLAEIASGVRLSLKAYDTAVASGRFVLNMLA